VLGRGERPGRMLVLFETPGGYALFKVLNEGKLKDVENIWKEFETPEKAASV
jgi:nucleolar protein 58